MGRTIEEFRKVKLVYVDGCHVDAEINGNDKQIIEFVIMCNMANSDINTQIKEIELEADTVGFPGCSARTVVYPFNYNESYKCYIY